MTIVSTHPPLLILVRQERLRRLLVPEIVVICMCIDFNTQISIFNGFFYLIAL